MQLIEKILRNPYYLNTDELLTHIIKVMPDLKINPYIIYMDDDNKEHKLIEVDKNFVEPSAMVIKYTLAIHSNKLSNIEKVELYGTIAVLAEVLDQNITPRFDYYSTINNDTVDYEIRFYLNYGS